MNWVKFNLLFFSPFTNVRIFIILQERKDLPEYNANHYLQLFYGAAEEQVNVTIVD